MRILLANKYFFLNGGSERVFFQERDFLLKAGVEVIDFSMADDRNFDSSYSAYFTSNVDFRQENLMEKLRGARQFIHSKEAVRKLQQLVTLTSPTMAHLHNIYHQLTPSIIPLLKERGIPVVLTVHDGKLICPAYSMLDRGSICVDCGGTSFWKPVSRNCQQSRLNGILLSLEAYWHRMAKSYEGVDTFVVPSRFIADVISKRVPHDKIKVIHNGVDLSHYRPSFTDRGYALYFGRLSAEKGVETLLKAHATFKGTRALKIVGTGALLEDLKEKYGSAEFLGYKTGNELSELIAQAAFVVVPSECYENCSMAVLEAMALGKPVIGSRIGGIPEQIDEGRTGLLFEMGNACELSEKMNVLWKDQAFSRALGKAARSKVEREYSLDQHCTQLMDTYWELL